MRNREEHFMNKKQYIAPALALVIVAKWPIYLRASTASMNYTISHEKGTESWVDYVSGV
jgi:hypothetical protein